MVLRFTLQGLPFYDDTSLTYITLHYISSCLHLIPTVSHLKRLNQKAINQFLNDSVGSVALSLLDLWVEQKH